MMEVLTALAGTPLPTLLALGGVLFLAMAFASKLGASFKPNPERQKVAGVCGVCLIVVAVVLYLVPTLGGAGSDATTAGAVPPASEVAAGQPAAPVEETPVPEPVAAEPSPEPVEPQPTEEAILDSPAIEPPPPTAVPSAVPSAAPTAVVATRAYELSPAFDAVWTRHGGMESRLGGPIGPEVASSFAEQRFENGLMHWGHAPPLGAKGVLVIERAASGVQSVGAWGRFADSWQEGDPEFACDQAAPPLGPKRGFGGVWCAHAQDALGRPIEEERAAPGSYQNFAGGVMLWSPSEHGVYLLFEEGDWVYEVP